MAAVHESATSNVVVESYLWLVPCRLPRQGADMGPCGRQALWVERRSLISWLGEKV
jgi:hypothetical protein